ncbi:MAG: sugar ABC transporter substrate-binding protein [Acidimicrobiales bacterium]|jgi:ribose transport system substrate-binding protein
MMVKTKMRWVVALAAGATLLSTTMTGLGVAQAAAKHKHYTVAYMSYGVANSYDAPMLAAAEAVAAADGVKVHVFDSQSSYTTQVSQLQDVVASGQYQGILVQPIYGAALIPTIKLAIKKKIKVVNIDQILGTNYASDQIEVHGLSGNVVFFPSKIGSQLATLANQACNGANPCNIALIHNYLGDEPDSAITTAFDATLAKDPSDTIVASADGLYEPSVSLTQVQDILTAHPNLNVIVGADQNCEGAQSALTAIKNTSVQLVCYGASAAGVAALKSGAWFADVAQMPATEGQLGMIALVKALKTGKGSGSQNPVAALPDNGILTKANVNTFTAEWPG